VAFGYGLFTGGFGLHYGIERVGAAIIPAAAGNTRRQIEIMRDLDPEVLICTPSYALTIADSARELGIDPRSLPIRYGHFGGEPWTEDMRREIEDQLDIAAFNNYGLSEVIGPGVSGECAGAHRACTSRRTTFWSSARPRDPRAGAGRASLASW
jgi:phenylacetate-CoA ligase